MIQKEEMLCNECGEVVVALVETKKIRGKESSTPLSCERSLTCPRTTFCRFVNPLTTRNPLSEKVSQEKPANV